MIGVCIDIAFAMLGLALLLNMLRLLRGPDLTDRVLALDTLYINAAAMLVLYGLQLGTARYYEAALLIAMLGFLSTLALAKFMLRGDLIE